MSEMSESEKLQQECEPLPAPVIDPEYAISSASAYGRALAAGWVVILPEENEIFIDIDNSQDLAKFEELWPTLKQFRPNAEIIRNTSSPSGKADHRHIVVDLKTPVHPCERIMLQVAMGSDRKRELLAWRRIENEDEFPTLFFEKPESAT